MKPSASSFGVSVSAWPEIQAGKPWSQPCIQAAVSGSAIFLAGEAGIGCTEGVFLVSATMFKLVRLSRVSWKRSTKIFDVEQFELQDTKIVLNKLSFEILRLYLASSKI